MSDSVLLKIIPEATFLRSKLFNTNYNITKSLDHDTHKKKLNSFYKLYAYNKK